MEKLPDINLNDFIWEEEDFLFEPKKNTYGNYLSNKTRDYRKMSSCGFSKWWQDFLYTSRRYKSEGKCLQVELLEQFEEDDMGNVRFAVKNGNVFSRPRRYPVLRG